MSRFRLLFEKRGFACFVRHVELPQLLGRVARRAGVALELTEGFSPHPKVVMGPALPVGVPSLGELAELWSVTDWDERDLMNRLNDASPGGFRFLAARLVEGTSLNRPIEAAAYWVCPRDEAKTEALLKTARACYGDGLLSARSVGDGIELALSSPSSLGAGILVRALASGGVLSGWSEVCMARLALGCWDGSKVVPLMEVCP